MTPCHCDTSSAAEELCAVQRQKPERQPRREKEEGRATLASCATLIHGAEAVVQPPRAVTLSALLGNANARNAPGTTIGAARGRCSVPRPGRFWRVLACSVSRTRYSPAAHLVAHLVARPGCSTRAIDRGGIICNTVFGVLQIIPPGEPCQEKRERNATSNTSAFSVKRCSMRCAMTRRLAARVVALRSTATRKPPLDRTKRERQRCPSCSSARVVGMNTTFSKRTSARCAVPSTTFRARERSRPAARPCSPGCAWTWCGLVADTSF